MRSHPALRQRAARTHMPDRLGKQVPFNKMEIVVTLTVLMVLALFAIVVSTIFARGSGLSRAQKLFYGHKLEDDSFTVGEALSMDEGGEKHEDLSLEDLKYFDDLQFLQPPTLLCEMWQCSQMLNSTSRQSISASASAPMPANYVRRIRRKAQLSRNAHDYRQQIADLKMLADSASRSGNVYQALQAYHKMGVVFDNQGMYDEAIMKYKQFLALCITSKNTQGEALAYNCLGIDCFKMGQYDEAIQYHNKHLELADSTGRLIAHTNLGIVFQAMGLSEHAAIHHQHAIEYANRMGSKAKGKLGWPSTGRPPLEERTVVVVW
ncbi:Tetratricopeptide repeat protein 28 (TPR repeat protein 28) (TPR repeat-containing big gene cloned at Keio) [Durusdinium trenchii]|uniref:Tetratricopeptide repeat protein 28 (TPR repeat protein 28) (TPR repeat-containing big gene cloned at Keio) n=1 Tax=Durusdinium trenchii TaxID=1381693 RepID=A0ABP0JX18_9DINO